MADGDPRILLACRPARRVVPSVIAAALCVGGAAAQAPVGEWTLRAAPGGDPIAVSAGPGGVRDIMLFCLSGVPFMAIRFDEPRGDPEISVGFDFPDGATGTVARREDGLEGAFVADLSDGTLAGALAGRDAAVEVSVDDVDMGTLSLSGSSGSIRGALASCLDVDAR